MIEPQDLDRFYATLLRDIDQRYGPLDPMRLAAIIGFDVGGLLLSTQDATRLQAATSGSHVKSLFATIRFRLRMADLS